MSDKPLDSFENASGTGPSGGMPVPPVHKDFTMTQELLDELSSGLRMRKMSPYWLVLWRVCDGDDWQIKTMTCDEAVEEARRLFKVEGVFETRVMSAWMHARYTSQPISCEVHNPPEPKEYKPGNRGLVE